MKKIKERRLQDSGVSEIIGSILLVSLVVGLMMVVTTVVISQPRPDKVPELSASISNNTTNIYITHTGGDALQYGEYLVVIDGNKVNPWDYCNSDGTRKVDEWSFGKPTIVIKNLANPTKTVQIYYTGPSSKVLLAQSKFE